MLLCVLFLYIWVYITDCVFVFCIFYMAAFKRHYALRLAIASEFFYCSYMCLFYVCYLGCWNKICMYVTRILVRFLTCGRLLGIHAVSFDFQYTEFRSFQLLPLPAEYTEQGLWDGTVSVCPSAAAGLLLCRWAADIDRLLQQRWANAGSDTLSAAASNNNNDWWFQNFAVYNDSDNIPPQTQKLILNRRYYLAAIFWYLLFEVIIVPYCSNTKCQTNFLSIFRIN